MKKQVTTWLMRCAQLLVALLLWCVVVLERGLTYCLVRLGNPILCRPSLSVLGKIVEKRKPQADARSDLDLHWEWLEGQDASFVAGRREKIEAFCGVPVSAQRNDPHLYAVAEPTKQENLLRIAYVLRSLPPWRLRKWVAEMADALR